MTQSLDVQTSQGPVMKALQGVKCEWSNEGKKLIVTAPEMVRSRLAYIIHHVFGARYDNLNCCSLMPFLGCMSTEANLDTIVEMLHLSTVDVTKKEARIYAAALHDGELRLTACFPPPQDCASNGA